VQLKLFVSNLQLFQIVLLM